MVETQMNHDETEMVDELPLAEVERNGNDEDLEESSSSIVYSELNDDEEKDLNASKLLDATSSHAFYGYEEAAPQVQQRHEQNKPYRRNSIVNQIMTWAGAIRDDDFYNSSNTNFTNHKTKNTRSLEQRTTCRRASVHGTAPTTQIQPNSRLNPLRQRVASSDDVTLLDHNDGLEQGEDCNIEGDDDQGGFRRHYDHPNRRNSLHAMIERAMAHVNQTKNYDDDDLTPFGNRRDSLF